MAAALFLASAAALGAFLPPGMVEGVAGTSFEAPFVATEPPCPQTHADVIMVRVIVRNETETPVSCNACYGILCVDGSECRNYGFSMHISEVAYDEEASSAFFVELPADILRTLARPSERNATEFPVVVYEYPCSNGDEGSDSNSGSFSGSGTDSNSGSFNGSGSDANSGSLSGSGSDAASGSVSGSGIDSNSGSSSG
ncbi:hypothetical protein DIPPA_51120, partial [Diplonema papillatum]